ncbi:hypothetical protein C439_09105 [Haloferax mediterranei ATCC 33500]|uniref:Uncharacterized protein n=2 Tax=Haloferax mediterranei (strain ATCC 33500 / DSM 1411 / JCM 8866 / NBRC 14739 / NCIMB 2177 / R-4) TaxID=523841 RepID=M0J4S3_HALMT|nr:hypothetical protein C439_09105 [Haloferax mediterranei ATCC 33500]
MFVFRHVLTPKWLYLVPAETSHMTDPLVVDGIVDFLVGDPVFTGLLVAILLFVFFAYLLVRRTLLGLSEGYDEARRR